MKGAQCAQCAHRYTVCIVCIVCIVCTKGAQSAQCAHRYTVCIVCIVYTVCTKGAQSAQCAQRYTVCIVCIVCIVCTKGTQSAQCAQRCTVCTENPTCVHATSGSLCPGSKEQAVPNLWAPKKNPSMISKHQWRYKAWNMLCDRSGSNQGPQDTKPCALPTALRARYISKYHVFTYSLGVQGPAGQDQTSCFWGTDF
jgi:hypothetical protein